VGEKVRLENMSKKNRFNRNTKEVVTCSDKDDRVAMSEEAAFSQQFYEEGKVLIDRCND
jgi:hypothetical protein